MKIMQRLCVFVCPVQRAQCNEPTGAGRALYYVAAQRGREGDHSLLLAGAAMFTKGSHVCLGMCLIGGSRLSHEVGGRATNHCKESCRERSWLWLCGRVGGVSVRRCQLTKRGADESLQWLVWPCLSNTWHVVIGLHAADAVIASI